MPGGETAPVLSGGALDFAVVFPIVFFPGAGGRLGFWRPVAERLADVCPTLLLAWPGFGDQPAEQTISSLDGLYHWALSRLPAGPLYLVAQSMGGVLAAVFSAPPAGLDCSSW